MTWEGKREEKGANFAREMIIRRIWQGLGQDRMFERFDTASDLDLAYSIQLFI